MIDHLAINTTSETHGKTVDFYVRTLEPLGYKKAMEFMNGKVVGFSDGKDSLDFWVGVPPPEKQEKGVASIHFAFAANTQKLVDAVYAKGIEAGGKDNGAPGLRPQYHPTYYGAFMLDPAGNNMEIVCHSGQEQ